MKQQLAKMMDVDIDKVNDDDILLTETLFLDFGGAGDNNKIKAKLSWDDLRFQRTCNKLMHTGLINRVPNGTSLSFKFFDSLILE